MAPTVGEVGEVGEVGAVTAGLLAAPLRVVVLVAPAGCRLANVDQAGLLASAHVADKTGLCRGCALVVVGVCVVAV